MKKLFLLSVLLLVLAVSVSAAFNTVPVNIMKTTAPAQASVSVRTAMPPAQEDCPTMCKRLISQGMGVFIRCMHDRCKEDCESSCREMYGSQSQDCIVKFCMPQVSEPPKETCEQGCGRKLDACLKTTVGINAESIRAACTKLHDECMQEECEKPEQPPQTCEQGCDKDYKVCLEKTVGLNMESVRAACEKFRNECVQQCGKPETCEQGCDKEHKICLDKTVGFNAEGIKTACDSNRKNCIMQCAPKPVSCEGRCEKIMDDCKANNVDLKSCQSKIDACKRQCKQPECPDYNCEMSCVKEYHGCTEGDCKGVFSQCVDGCFGSEDPQAAVRCRKECRNEKLECLDNGGDLGFCGWKNGMCQQACPPLPPDWVPPPLSCQEECRESNLQCREEGRDRGVCSLSYGVCLHDCPESIEPGGQTVARAPEVPDGGAAPSSKKLSPKDMAGLNPQPEPPSKQGKPQDWAGLNPQPEPPSIWRRIAGWFGG